MLTVAIKKKLKAALSVLHKGERDVACNVLAMVIKTFYDENSNGRGKPSLVDSRKLVRTVRRELRNCVSVQTHLG